MTIHSAGILLYRFNRNQLEVMLVHPGGPFWAKKDNGAWSIPKGLVEEEEPLLNAAQREFKEETGASVQGDFIELGALKQPSKKVIHAWALEHDLNTTQVVSNTFELEWPKNSGIIKEYPEIDTAVWFAIEDARQKILKGQAKFLDILLEKLASRHVG